MRWFILMTPILCWAMSCHSQSSPRFDADHAFFYLQKQCTFGARVPGSAAHQQCREFLLQSLRATADQVTTQPFLHTFAQPPRTVTATNIIANFSPQEKKRILLCAHWDCRHVADQDPDPKNRQKPVMGANDGASGVAILLEIARILKQHKPPVGIDIVLFDGEDQGTSADDRSYARGSAVFAKQLLPSYRPTFGILLDMVGDRDLQIYQELYSLRYAKFVLDKVWQVAAQLGMNAFIPQPGHAVFDDHVPLLERGIPCIDIIDFDYPYWHTTSDTPDKCSVESLNQVGSVILYLIYNP